MFIAFFLCPGYSVLKLLKIKLSRLNCLVVAASVGLALSPMLYFFSMLLLNQYLYLFIIVVSIVYSIYAVMHVQEDTSSNGQLIRPDVLYILIPFIIIFIFLHLSHFSDVRFIKDGGVLFRAHYMTESLYHLGIISRVSAVLPPTYPYAAGYAMPYHIDMHLMAVIISEYGFIDIITTTFIYLPYVLLFLLFSTAAVFLRETGIKSALLCVSFGLFLFAADFSFVPGLMMDAFAGKPWTLIFKTTIWSLFTLNGIIPSLIVFFIFLIILNQYLRKENYALLILIVFLVYSAYRMKSSMGPQIAACGIAVSILMMISGNRKIWFALLGSLFFSSLLICADLILKPEYTEKMIVLSLLPFNGMLQTASQLNIPALIKAAQSPSSHLILFVLFLMIYVIGFMGVRLLVFKYVISAFRENLKDNGLIIFLLVFCFTGIILSEFLYLGEKHMRINNAGWFAVQSLFAAMFFPFLFLSRLKNRALAFGLLGCLMMISFPTTIHFLSLRHNPAYVEISKDQLQVVEYIKANTNPDDVIWEIPEKGRPSLSAHLSGRKTVLATYVTFITAVVSKKELRNRINDFRNFYHIKTTNEERKKILEKYDVSYIIDEACVQNTFNRMDFLKIVYQNKSVRVYLFIS